MTIATVEVDGRGDIAYEVGTYTFTKQDGTVLDHGKFIVVWKLVEGEWQVHRDIYNSSVPPPAAQEVKQ
jgi:ketosteroid isomerase-like protein